MLPGCARVLFTDVAQALTMRAIHAHTSSDEVRFGPQRLVVYLVEDRIAAAEIGEPDPSTTLICSIWLRSRPQ